MSTPPLDAAAAPLFSHEIRREGRVVATLKGLRTGSSVTVETAVFPVTAAQGEQGLSRPFAFPSAEHARRFADEALVAFEYLNCVVA